MKGAVLWKLLFLTLILALAVVAWLARGYQQFRIEPMVLPSAGLIYELKPGTSLRRVATDLHEQGAIPHALWLVALGRHTGKASRIQAGEYHFPAGTTPQQMLDKLVQGKVVQHEFTIVEGHTFRELLARIHGSDILIPTLMELPDAEIMKRLGYEGIHPEGRFLPDTYRFPRGTTDVAFLQRAYSAMQDRLADAWKERSENLPLKTPYEALILASIIEKETGKESERPAIAGVFVRRLQKRMRLQTDPTVIYGIGASFDGDIRYRDLRKDTPYNTYTRGGLPPTPIAMPGLAAINAALHPADGKALYFVAKGDGSHQFSATLAEHNRAVQTYQKKR